MWIQEIAKEYYFTESDWLHLVYNRSISKCAIQKIYTAPFLWGKNVFYSKVIMNKNF